MSTARSNQAAQELRAEARIAADLDQAWQHHRHLAEKGQKLLDRFMTLAGSGAAVGVVAVDKTFDVKVIAIFAVALFLATLLCAAIARAFAANKGVMDAYDDYFRRAMHYYYAGQSRVPCIWDLRKLRPEPARLWIFSAADAEQMILYLVLIALTAGQGLLILECRTGRESGLVWLVPASLFLVSLLVTFVMFFRWIARIRRRHSASRMANKLQRS